MLCFSRNCQTLYDFTCSDITHGTPSFLPPPFPPIAMFGNPKLFTDRSNLPALFSFIYVMQGDFIDFSQPVEDSLGFTCKVVNTFQSPLIWQSITLLMIALLVPNYTTQKPVQGFPWFSSHSLMEAVGNRVPSLQGNTGDLLILWALVCCWPADKTFQMQ